MDSNPRPWHVVPEHDADNSHLIVDRTATPLARVYEPASTPDGQHPLSSHIVACVNACEGIKDPAAEIPRLQSAAKMAANVDVAFNDGHDAGRAELLAEMGLAGCADPAAALAEVREVLATAAWMLTCEGQDPGNGDAVIAGNLRRALARLGDPARCTSTSTGHGHTGEWTNRRHLHHCESEYTCGGPNGCGRRFTIDSSD